MTDSQRTSPPHLVLVGGGARSGKSALALARARALGDRRAFIATATAGDEEMAVRIDQHRTDRGDDFDVIEEPLDLIAALARCRDHDVTLIDCLTLWVSNLLCREPSPGDGTSSEVGAIVRDTVGAIVHHPRPVIVVSNEVGLGVVPNSALGRVFRDEVGRLHQLLARAADEVYMAAMGLSLRLKPTPIEPIFPGAPGGI